MPSGRVIVVGGTIDKVYDELTGQVGFAATHIPSLLRQARCNAPSVAIEVVMLKDSLDMTDEDRGEDRDACIRSSEDRIVITHGTDTMVETARVIAAALSNKTVVLVGAMVPWSMGSSDAAFNMGAAMTAAQLLQPGVYVTMNGGVFDGLRVRKNRALGVFELA